MKLQILAITWALTALAATPLFAQEQFGIHVTPHEVEPAPGEFTNVSKRVLDSAEDLRKALRKNFRLVSREDADIVLWITGGSSYLPAVDRTTISSTGARTVVDQRTTGYVPIRGVVAWLMVPGTDYRHRYYANAIWRWRSAAGAMANRVATWVEQNAATLMSYRENPPELRAVISDLSTGNWIWEDAHYTKVGGTIRNAGTVDIGGGWRIHARFFASDGTPIAEAMDYFFDEPGLPAGSQQEFDFSVDTVVWSYFVLEVLNRDDVEIPCVGSCGQGR